MGKILQLPPDLANQIAAGEVVERPASVVKELVENAIDAGARRITVAVELGGKRRIRVDDDGSGMDPDDARLAVERHATSKIRRADDLARIGTLGFRGEALPSIASVCHFTLKTRTRGAPSGTEVVVDRGRLASVKDAGVPEGTSIEVVDLFCNLPARRKFLKSDAAESAQVSRIVTQLALCYPEIGFTLTSAGRKVLQCPPVTALKDRLYQLYGERDDLVELNRPGEVSVHGFVAALAEQGPTRGPQHVFVNRRVVKDRTIAHAIIDAYSVASIKERSPEVHLFIEMPLDAIDVNVHPTKAEVRFREQSHIHELIRRSVSDALGRGPAPELRLEPTAAMAGLPSTLSLPHAYPTTVPSRWTTGPAIPTSARPAHTEDVGSAGAGAAVPAATGIRPLTALGQFRNTFIVAIDDEGIAIIDQHVAHERVLFERMTERLNQGTLESQRLLVPMLLSLSASARQALVGHARDLERLGFEVEEFGGDALRVTAIPALLGADDCDAALRALAEDLEGLDKGRGVDAAIKRIAATMACHAAVKANDALTADKMAYILDELRQTAHSTICPHGRPVMLRITRREVEKNFQRI